MFKSTIVGVAAAQFLGEPLTEGDQQFLRFVSKHGKRYESRAEFDMRNQIFQEKLAAIREHNQRSDVTHSLGVNAFTDLTDEEWATKRGYIPSVYNGERVSFKNVTADDSKDWFSEGVVSPVMDQIMCGSCWAFSAVGAIESAHAIKNGDLTQFSV